MNQHALDKYSRGERLRRIRRYLKLSRADIQQRYGIPAPSLQNWEDCKGNGLTEKGARRLASAFQTEGVACTAEWLLYGLGQDPLANTYNEAADLTTSPNATQDPSTQELAYFHRINPNAIHAILPDNLMQPYYQQGDIVAGKLYFADQIDTLHNNHCIVQTIDGQVLVRRLLKSNSPHHFDLQVFQGKNHQPEITHTNITLLSAAPIIWIRKRQ